MTLELLLAPETWISLLTLAAMEIVLGIDNIVFLSILTSKLPKAEQPRARQLGLGLALVSRLGLLFALSWIMRLTEPFFSVAGHGFSGRDLILLGGGAFLVGKATHEIYEKVELGEHGGDPKAGGAGFAMVLVQIMFLDIIFSLDSVITAVGMAKDLPVMVAAMVVAMIVMLVFSGRVSDFIERHPSMKILALAFLVAIGMMLTVEGMGQHVSKGYIYTAMAFSLSVEAINMRFRHKQGQQAAPTKKPRRKR
jgi:predicted tellurium resistance membrane protein TerC